MKPAAIPPDLKPLVLELKKIRRFVNAAYPQAVFKDNVYRHTLRCIALADRLAPLFADPSFPLNPALLKRILWIHDMVEIGLEADIPAPDKMVNPTLLHQVEKAEFLKAKRLLNPADFNLWEQFELAKNVLAGELLHRELLVEAMLARIIDVLDGNIHFNRSLVRSLAKNHSLNLPEHSLVYAFKTNAQYYRVIQKDLQWEPLKPILEAERQYIQNLWDAIDVSLIPAALHPHLNN